MPARAPTRRHLTALALAGAVVVVAACSGEVVDRRGAGESQIIDDDAGGRPIARPGEARGGVQTDEDGTPITYPRVPFAQVDAELEQRVRQGGLSGASLLVVQDGGVLHRHDVGALDAATEVSVGESGRWLLAVLVAMLADEGRLALDDPVVAHLPWLAAGDPAKAAVTVRQLLSHTSGLTGAVDCEAAGSCDSAVAAAPVAAPPGEVFAVSAVDDHLLARLAETVSGLAWPTVLRERLLDPLGMVATDVPSGAGPTDPAGPTGPADPTDPARPSGGSTTLLGGDLRTTGLDLGRFAAFVLARGITPDNRRLVSEQAVLALERDETARLDTASEPWVAWTGIPTYGLGVWRDRLRGDDTASMVSAAGRYGAYPWVDRSRNAYGVLVVEDRDGAGERAVTASARLIQGLLPPAIDTEGRALRRPGTPVTGVPG